MAFEANCSTFADCPALPRNNNTAQRVKQSFQNFFSSRCA
jgi:hypothetical protein